MSAASPHSKMPYDIMLWKSLKERAKRASASNAQHRMNSCHRIAMHSFEGMDSSLGTNGPARPEWYHGLTENRHFEDIQNHINPKANSARA
uniref:SFRICE_011252 n=1 Tax=Spodoptera frugiperda TaxID=7108 RepID=A0A2H1V2V4_SPOFR